MFIIFDKKKGLFKVVSRVSTKDRQKDKITFYEINSTLESHTLFKDLLHHNRYTVNEIIGMCIIKLGTVERKGLS